MSMRTAIYVFEPSTVTIRAKDPGEDRVTLCRFNRRAEQVALGTRELEAGIYMILSSRGVEVSGGQISVVPLAGDKDVPPEPKAQVLGLEQGANAAAILQFFLISKGIEVDDPPAQPESPAAPDTAEITDDPDGI